MRHVLRLTRNLILLGLLHEEGSLYYAPPDRKILRVMQGGETIIVDERS